MSEQVIWLMDSDFCDNCGALLDLSDCDGLCFTCSELYLMEEDDEEWYDFGEDEDFYG